MSFGAFKNGKKKIPLLVTIKADFPAVYEMFTTECPTHIGACSAELCEQLAFKAKKKKRIEARTFLKLGF